MPDFLAPRGFILLRVIGATILFWVTSIVVGIERIKKEDLLRFVICALFGVAINQILFFEGLNLTTPINASIIMVSNPIIVMLAASLLLKEKITAIKLFGIGLGLSGATSLLLMKGPTSFGEVSALGDLLIFINAISYGVFLVLVKPLMVKYSPLTTIKWVFTFGLIIVTPFCFSQLVATQWYTFTTPIILEVGYVVICTTFIAYLLNISALKNLEASVVSMYLYLQPFFAACISIYLGQDEIDNVKIFSALLIYSGVWIVSRPQKSGYIS